MLTGSAVTNVEEAREAARELLKRGCKSVIVTLGPQGCVVIRAQGATPKHVATAAAVTAVDTTVSALDKGSDAALTEKGEKRSSVSAEIDFSPCSFFLPSDVILDLLGH